ncbi:MAG: tRNA (N(6)-L-threonylcarbamoyladenosine(37)-C(2))-methylthiotransferase MtaB [Victivallales bacterium]|nr:tRNA (N(6)-L-threonylcarbamoyladenosine(37)-C(2))-methylthiotransferase MtaB [Victivallales bacterium]
MPGNTRTVAALTLGCRLNQADTALIFDRLGKAGFSVVKPEHPGGVDVMIVNTCTVTGTAAQKSRQAVRKFRRSHPDCCIVVTGCSAGIENSMWHDEPAVDLLLPNTEKKHIAEHLARYFKEHRPLLFDSVAQEWEQVFSEQASGSFPFKSRALLKVQEGCNSFCSYCIVPYARGRERSRDWREIIDEFKSMLDNGYREIVITGVNVSTYNHQGRKLPELLHALLSINGDYRIRLSSTEPHPDNRALLDLIADNDKVCRFLHLSVQHGTDEILTAMNRHYTIAEFSAFVAEARSRIPNIHIGTDIITGFPGETDQLFEETCDFARRMHFANTHIFTFSPREGTPAATFPDQIPADKAKQRHDELSRICSASAQEYLRDQQGATLPVLFERRLKSGELSGWSDNYVKVLCKDKSLSPNSLAKVYVESCVSPDAVMGKVVI